MIEFRLGDVFDRLAEIPDRSINLVVTSPPFLGLRAYLPADHEHKHREIGSEATPAEFLDTLLAVTAELGRVLTADGSLCVELGDTYSGSGGAGGDYNPGGMRDGQERFKQGPKNAQPDAKYGDGRDWSMERTRRAGKRDAPYDGWPLAKSRTLIDLLYPACLAYGRNLLTGEPSPAGQFRVRNVIVWARPNPPPGALSDKFRPGTSYITVACRERTRYFDLDAVRQPYSPDSHPRAKQSVGRQPRTAKTAPDGNRATLDDLNNNGAGAPPLDWHDDMPELEDGDWLWRMSSQPYKGSHYATFPMELPKRLILAMCPPGGTVLDPFVGSGTTLEAAQAVGRHGIGIDFDERNLWLARERCGMFLETTA